MFSLDAKNDDKALAKRDRGNAEVEGELGRVRLVQEESRVEERSGEERGVNAGEAYIRACG
jgi:hypothetical protein